MAPNTKQASLSTCIHFPVDAIVSKPTLSSLTQESQQAVEEADVYWTWEATQTEQGSYWDWTANPSKDVLSCNHIVKSLVKSHNVNTDLVQSNVDSGKYWDESTSAKEDEARTVSAQHVNEESVESYWEWPQWSEDVEERKAPVLRGKTIRRMLAAHHITANLLKEASDIYWNETNLEIHNNAPHYWESPTATPLASSEMYWEWVETAPSA